MAFVIFHREPGEAREFDPYLRIAALAKCDRGVLPDLVNSL